MLSSLMAVALLTTTALAAPSVKHSEKDATKMLDGIDDMYRATSAHGVMTMKVQTENWSRELKIEFWSKGKDKSLMRIKAPRKEKGTTTLRSEGNIWNYLPKVKRVIKVPSSMMGGSWMGSHFTNDDLVKQSRMADDFDFKITFDSDKDGKRENESQVEIACIPKTDAAVVWGKIAVILKKLDGQYVAKRIIYYDEDMVLSRTMTFGEFKKIDGHYVAMFTKIQPEDEPGEFTQMSYEKLEFNVGIKDSKFTLRSLQR